jgi:hypothetical protein
MADIGHKLGQMQYYQALSANGGSKSSTMAVANALIAQGVDPITAISFAKSGIGTRDDHAGIIRWCLSMALRKRRALWHMARKQGSSGRR